MDLRDGNQALIEPMSLEEKIEFFQMLLDVGFKQIEVGFPAASETEYQFLRTLIEQNMIPEDVTIQVLTQAREHIIKRTFEAVKGAPHAVIHLYNSTSVAQREQVFKKNKEENQKIAVDGAILLNELAKETEGNFTFEYSPEVSRNRGGLCAGSVQCSSQSVGAVQGAKSDHQSSDNRGKRDAACVRKSGGIYEQALI